jgi:polyphenol oxidase
VAAVHAGWRGTAAKIGPVAIARLLSQGSQLANLRIAMGPAIAGEVYQVSTTVAAQVAATVIPDAEPEEVLAKAQNLSNPPILSDSQPGRARLDVRRVNALQLEQLGIASEQIAIAPFCTFQTPELFFSYRRDRLKKVQWSGIVSRGS